MQSCFQVQVLSKGVQIGCYFKLAYPAYSYGDSLKGCFLDLLIMISLSLDLFLTILACAEQTPAASRHGNFVPSAHSTFHHRSGKAYLMILVLFVNCMA